MMARGYRLAVGEQGIIGYATGVREPRIALDVGEDAVRFDSSALPDTRSEIALPLIAGDRLLGALDIQSNKQAAFTEEDVAVLQILAHLVAVAIENAYLFAESQAALEAERQAYTQMSSEAWSQTIGGRADLGYLCDAQEVRPVSAAWQPEMIQASQAGQTVRDDGPTVAVPIKIRDQVTGVVRLRKPEGASGWTTDELTLVEDLTRQLGLTLESARHYRETQRRALREQMTTEITAHIRETLDIDTILQTAIRELGDALHIAKAQVRMGVKTISEDTKVQEDI
jgi:GAF domain-containing protein